MAKTNKLKVDPDEALALSARLNKTCKKNEETGCIEWTGALMYQGYGHVNWRGTVLRTHRASYAVKHGEVPKGKIVCHKCDNRKCINPDHLFIGTAADNSKDMAGKKRSTLGEKNPMSKLDIAKVQAIRIWGKTGMHQKNIAAKFNVSREAIGLILRNERWKGV